MRAVDYSDILRGSAGLAGMNYVPGDSLSDIGTPEFRLFRTYHDRRLQMAWEIHRWPEICPVEERQYRATYSAAENVTATTERYHIGSGKYYQALVAQTPATQAPATYAAGGWTENSAYWAVCAASYAANDWITGTVYTVTNGAATQVRDPLTGLFYQIHTAHTAGATLDTTKMGLLTAFNKYVAYAQTGETAIGELFTASQRDPRIFTQNTAYRFWNSQDGFQFGQESPNVLWLYFRQRRPVLKGEVFDATATYASGQQVYFVDSLGVGNFWTANDTTSAGEDPEDTPAKWDVVEIPYSFRGYLIESGYVDWLTGDDKETIQLREKHEGFAAGYLELEADKLQRQQQQVRRLGVNLAAA